MWIVGFLAVLGPLVTVHELGHYLVGRWFGVKADVFSIGFGRELTGWTDRRGTRWKLSALPLGGYVQFAGDMNPASQPSAEWLALPERERAKTFQSKPLWQRALIVAAGPFTNFAVAIAILAAFNLAYGKIVSTPYVAGFEQQSDARAAGVRIGDTILAVNGNSVESYLDVMRHVSLYPNKAVTLTVERDGRELAVPVKLGSRTEKDRFGNETVIADLGVDFTRAIVGGFAEGSPAEEAGLRVGDRIAAIDGVEVEGFQSVAERLKPRPGETVSITVARGEQMQTYRIRLAEATERLADGSVVPVGMLGVAGTRGEVVPVGLVESVTLGVRQTAEIVEMMVTGIWQIVTGHRSVDELGGPIKIAKFSGEQLSLGWRQFVSFAALISINLAFINLLPIPALDGGHLAFYAAEAVRRKPIGARGQEWAFRTGIAFVLALMLFVTINDVTSLFLRGS